MAELEGTEILQRFVRRGCGTGGNGDHGGQESEDLDHSSLISINRRLQIAAPYGTGKAMMAVWFRRVALRPQVRGRKRRLI
ncbi:hypothetical protein MACH17_02930 [Phaeobacter inhibens]|nr:hypothetical protein MACH17_02930 [Phaeobacter inhibens]